MTDADPIGRFLESCVAGGRMPGAVWWVEASRGVVSRGAVGAAVRSPRPEPATPATPYDLASLTKPLATATLLVLLEQERLLDLEAPVVSLLPGMRGTPYASTSLLSLAAHQSGLPAWWPLCAEASTLEGYVERIARRPPAVRPGRTLYSDLGYVLLGAALERVSGRHLADLFRQRIAIPLGLSRTGFAMRSGEFSNAAATERGNAYERAMAGRAGAGFAWREDVPRGEVHDANAAALGGAAGHAGLFGVIDEIARLGRALLRAEGLPIGARARARLLRVVPGSEGRTVGMVVGRYASAARGILPDEAPGHTGFTGTSIWLDPSGDRLFVLLTNRVHPTVPERSFQPVRRGFHRLALRAARAAA